MTLTPGSIFTVYYQHSYDDHMESQIHKLLPIIYFFIICLKKITWSSFLIFYYIPEKAGLSLTISEMQMEVHVQTLN